MVLPPLLLSLRLQEARQTGALQAAKTKLEKQCEELTWRLQLEKRMRVSEKRDLGGMADAGWLAILLAPPQAEDAVYHNRL